MKYNEISKFVQDNGEVEVLLAVKKEVKLLKKSRESGEPTPFKSIVKKQVFRGFMGLDYEEETNITKEVNGESADFESKGLSWGEWDLHPYIIKHKDAHYLRITHPDYTLHPAIYIADGKRMPLEKLAEYMPKPSSSKSDVKVVNVKFDSIESVQSLEHL